jgi:hypothetical protein
LFRLEDGLVRADYWRRGFAATPLRFKLFGSLAIRIKGLVIITF